ncbi:hypothetical protein ACU4GD_24225 [Cupriavidus basilensis]
MPPLHAVFQPIVAFGTGDILGYEALVRGPSTRRWPSPRTRALFPSHARQRGPKPSRSRLQAARAGLAGCLARGLRGKLFLNFSTMALRYLLAEDGPAQMQALMADKASRRNGW